jgi:hypothetical protein
VDKFELKHFSSQILPNNPNFLLNCFRFIEEKFFEKYKQYLLIDGHGKSKISQFYVRTNIFPDPNTKEITPIIFFPDL